MDEEYLEAVLDVTGAIARGKVLTYGDIAEIVGREMARGGPRQVGSVLKLAGGGVPWWRVINAAGLPPTHKRTEALNVLRGEGCPMSADGSRVNLKLARDSVLLERGIPPRARQPGSGFAEPPESAVSVPTPPVAGPARFHPQRPPTDPIPPGSLDSDRRRPCLP